MSERTQPIRPSVPSSHTAKTSHCKDMSFAGSVFFHCLLCFNTSRLVQSRPSRPMDSSPGCDKPHTSEFLSSHQKLCHDQPHAQLCSKNPWHVVILSHVSPYVDWIVYLEFRPGSIMFYTPLFSTRNKVSFSWRLPFLTKKTPVAKEAGNGERAPPAVLCLATLQRQVARPGGKLQMGTCPKALE